MASSGLNRWPGLPPGRAPARSARAPPKAGANGRGGYRRGRWDRMPEPLTRTVLGGALGPAGRASRPLNLASQWLVTQHHRSQPAVAARRNRDRARSATCRALSGGPCAPVRSPCRPKPGLATAFKAAGAPSHGVGCCSPLRSAEADAITGQSVAVGHAGRHNYPPRRVGVRRRITSGAGRFSDARLPEVVISLRKLLYRAGSAGLSQGLLQAPQKPHKSATRRPSPQESHGRNGTLRYTCDAC
jgi:hypothetical protein